MTDRSDSGEPSVEPPDPAEAERVAALTETAVHDFRPVPPVCITAETLDRLAWARSDSGHALLGYLLARGMGFPTVPLAHAARPGLDTVARILAAHLAHLGLNVFLAPGPVPLAALSVTVTERQLPIALYLDQCGPAGWTLLMIGGNGGPIDRREMAAVGHGEPLDHEGVVGEMAMLEPWRERLAGLLDHDPAAVAPWLGDLVTPFPVWEDPTLGDRPAWRRFSLRRAGGPIATVSPCGQLLTLTSPAGETLDGRLVVSQVLRYMISSRNAGGTVLGPEAVGSPQVMATPGMAGAGFSQQLVVGGWLEVAHRASFSDLLLAWSDDGWLAHQGHAPFGDALLTLGYLIEAYSDPSI